MSAENYKKVRMILGMILIANLAVAALKIIIGYIIQSAGMTADGFHSLADGSSNVVGLIGIHYASKPVDEDHPYGHNKFEMLAGLFIAGMLFFVGIKIILDAVSRFLSPVIPQVTAESLIVLAITLMINIFVSFFEYKKGKELNSRILVCDSMHTRSDIYISIGVLVTLLGIKLGLPPVIDSVASLIVSVFIFIAAYEIFRDNSGIMVDKAAADINKIKEIALGFEEVKDVHNIRSRGCENNLYIDMHIMTEPDLSVEQAHELAHRIEKKIRQELKSNVQLITHIEPFGCVGDD